jgi:hypothetical protein
MLSLESALSVDGLTIYRDYNDSKAFFYAPPNPKVAREGGQPLFQLLIYRRDITDNPSFKAGDRPGGGFLTMTVDLKLSDALRNKILDQLKKLAGDDVTLRPIPYERGGVRVSVLGTSSAASTAPDAADAGPRFVENILASTTPSLYDDNRVVFSVEMDHEGAQLMRASLEDEGASQVAVVYDLDFKGLMPAYKATIKIHFSQSFEHLRTRFTLNTLWFKADIDSEMEKLRKSGSIEITEIDFQGLAPEQQAAARDKLTQLAKDLATWTFFRPSITPGTVLAVDRGSLVAADPTAAASQVAAGFSEPLQAVATGRGSPGGTAGPMLQGESAESGTTTRAAGRPAPTGVAAEPTAGSGTTPAEKPLTAVERWNQMGRPQAAFLMRSLSQEEQHDISYTMTQVAAVKQTIAPQGQIRLLSGDASLKGRIKVVDLNDPFFERIAGTVTTSAELPAAGVSSMVIKIRYGVRDDGTAPKDTAEFRLTQKGQSESYQFFMDRRLSVEIEYQVVVNYSPGFALGDTATQAVSPWKRTTTRNLDIDPAEVAVLIPVEITVAQMDWAAVTAVETKLTYQDHPDAAPQEKTTMLSQNGKTAATIHLRPRDPRMRDYKLSVKYIFTNGTSATEEFKGSGAATFVINQPVALAVPVTVFSSDPLSRLSKLAVELSYTPAAGPEQTKLLTFGGGGENQVWTLMRGAAADPVKYKYRTTFFNKNGSQTKSEWQNSQERLLTVGDVFEDLLEVTAQVLLTDFRAGGIAGLRLKLRYPDAAPGADDDKEFLLMSPPAEPIKWVVPKKPGGGEMYEYTATWIKLDGTQKAVGPLTSGDEVLLLHPGLEG